MPSLMELLGSQLVRADETPVDTESLAIEGQTVGLFFSASWCPPCQAFTCKLLEFYNKFREANGSNKMEIILIGSDRDADGFQEYFKQMPWLALPFVDRDRKARLSKKFKIQGIPALVMIEGKSGKLITTDGRNNVLDDPEGQNFPWYPIPLADKLQGPLCCHTGMLDAEKAASMLRGKVKGFYFSAHWCPPCRVFTPALIEVYKKLQEDGRKFEVIYVSSDRSEDSFTEYHSTMPWPAIPHGDSRITALCKHFGVQGIPSLILVDENNEIISTNGRAVLAKDPDGKCFPWPPKPLNELNEVTAPRLNESACLIYFTDGEEDQMVRAQELLRDIACKYTEEQKASLNTNNELPELCFLFEGLEGDDIAESLRNLANLEDQCPLVAILDIPEQQAYAIPDLEVNAEKIQKLVHDFKTYQLTYTPLQL